MQTENIKKWWKKVKLGDLVEFCSRWISPKYSEKGIPIINQKCIRDNKINYSLCRFHNIDKKVSSEKLIKKYDILVNSTWVWTLWRLSQVKKSVNTVTVDSHVTIIRLNWTVNKEFIWFVLISKEILIESLWKWATWQTELSRDDLKNLEITIPESLQTQQKIASILSKYDDLIENNSKRIKILEEMAQTIYHQWFVKFKFPGHEKVNFVDSDTDFGKIPEWWEVKKVEDMIKKIPTWKKYNNKTVFEKWNVPVLDQWRSWIIGYHNDEPWVIATIENPIITFANHTCYQNIIMYPFSTIQNVFALLPNESNNSNIFWLHYATKDLIHFNDYKWHMPEFISKRMLYPWFELTEKFWKIIKPFLEEVFNLQEQNQNLKQTRDMLIPKLVSGEIDVDDLDVKI